MGKFVEMWLFTIGHSFWEGSFVWAIYTGVFLLFVLLVILIITHINKLRKRIDYEHELARLKLKFFTDISHELFNLQTKDEDSGFDMQKEERLVKRFEPENDADPTNDSSSVENDAEEIDVGQENRESRILIIDDNEELRHFIKNILSKEYKVLEAANGKEGLDITLKKSPDIVISDIMMPEMDGVEYLNAVKNDHDISHIPIILLTAKSSIDDRIKGMEYGADDYITKPFNSTYLKAKIASLIKKRELLREYYMSKNGDIKIQIQPNKEKEWEPYIPKITSYDDDFISKVIDGIESNLEETDFKIDILAKTMNMSRTVFYRKIKSIVGLSPIDFVKKIRIKRAIQLLEIKQFTIAEVAYQSGFTTPQYMSKVFKELMGCSPTEYLQMLQKTK